VENTQISVHEDANGRLADLGLTRELLFNVSLRADAEAKLSTDLDAPTHAGTTRFSRTTRFLREALVPVGWDYDNSRNYCRTIHPSGAFSIVVSSGDEGTGIVVAGQSPSTRYPKGEVTVQAVEINMQLVLELGEEFETPERREPTSVVWYLLQRVTVGEVFLELSLPTEIHNGVISKWEERIVLGSIPRDGEPTVRDGGDHGEEEASYDVTVAMR
jgi:hypothetical protein